MKKVLVTGANGFIGSHLICWLEKEGYQPIGGVRIHSSLELLNRLNVEIVRLNYDNETDLMAQIAAVKPNFIIHNAGVTVAKSEVGYFNGNVKTTKKLLKIASEIGVEKIILISSLAARGPGIERIDSPISAYGRSKLHAEELVRESGIPFSIVRPTAVYGPGDRAFMPMFRWASHGIFIKLGSKNRRFTFVYVQDLAKMITKCLDDEVDTLYGWDGHNYQPRELISALRKVTGKIGIILPIPSRLFRNVMGFLDFFIRRSFGIFWNYPPDKVAELLAHDWSIDEKYRPKSVTLTLEEGFSQTTNNEHG